jgi:hypothetical protein
MAKKNKVATPATPVENVSTETATTTETVTVATVTVPTIKERIVPVSLSPQQTEFAKKNGITQLGVIHATFADFDVSVHNAGRTREASLESVRKLAVNLSEIGQLSPVKAFVTSEGKLALIDGRTRVRALGEIASGCSFTDGTDLIELKANPEYTLMVEVFEGNASGYNQASVSANLNRVEACAVDRVFAVLNFKASGLSVRQCADIVSESRANVGKMFTLSKLPVEALNNFKDGLNEVLDLYYFLAEEESLRLFTTSEIDAWTKTKSTTVKTVKELRQQRADNEKYPNGKPADGKDDNGNGKDDNGKDDGKSKKPTLASLASSLETLVKTDDTIHPKAKAAITAIVAYAVAVDMPLDGLLLSLRAIK